jgi:hypothetical protein
MSAQAYPHGGRRLDADANRKRDRGHPHCRKLTRRLSSTNPAQQAASMGSMNLARSLDAQLARVRPGP